MNALTQRQALMILNALPGLGPARIGLILDAFDGSAAAALEAPLATLTKIRLIDQEMAAAVVSWRSHFDV
jgi:hypothetical protein